MLNQLKIFKIKNDENVNINFVGELAEWSKAHAWKARRDSNLSWVRIPHSPGKIKSAGRFDDEPL